MITINQIYYVAGILEGEGSFTFYKSPVISLGMTDIDVVAKIRDIISPEANIMQTKDERPNRKDTYRLAIYGAVAAQWMMTLYTLMGERRKVQIKSVLSEWKTKMQYRFIDGFCRHMHPFTREHHDFVYNINGAKVCLHCRKKRNRSISFRTLHAKGLHNVGKTK